MNDYTYPVSLSSAQFDPYSAQNVIKQKDTITWVLMFSTGSKTSTMVSLQIEA